MAILQLTNNNYLWNVRKICCTQRDTTTRHNTQ